MKSSVTDTQKKVLLYRGLIHHHHRILEKLPMKDSRILKVVFLISYIFSLLKKNEDVIKETLACPAHESFAKVENIAFHILQSA